MEELRWSPGLGDPTVGGWLTVVAYLCVAWLCLRAFMIEKAGPPRPFGKTIVALLRVLLKRWRSPPIPARRSLVWLGLAGFSLALAVEELLDLQTLLIEIGRLVAISEGWYDSRRAVQVGFMGALLLTMLAAVAGLGWAMRSQLRDFRLALVGLALLLAYVVLRSISLHGMEAFIGAEGHPVEAGWLLQLGGIAAVGFAAALRLTTAGAPVWRGWAPPQPAAPRPKAPPPRPEVVVGPPPPAAPSPPPPKAPPEPEGRIIQLG
ncbi:MAG: hypothetical protein AB1Z98_22070 [Nannocystaceae bacterium]